MRGKHLAYTMFLMLIVMACASIGNPDGGIYDVNPPKVVSSNPGYRSVSNAKKKISILFDEFIKLENANEKVIVSPPQIEPANIRAEGKKVKITLYDSLQANTTYTIDFSDAIQDNNEGNPMGNYTFSFSTGEEIDTMEISGTVLNAQDLEPIKGILVGLYPADSTFNDTLLNSTPFLRVSRTNGSGRFSIKGVKNGSYRAFALKDADGDFLFNQKSEMIAFDTTILTTSSKPDVRMDTIWRDSTHYDSIRVIPYTHFLPDDVVLLAFLEEGQDLHLLKTERPEPDFFKLYFTAPADSLPTIEGLNFDASCLLAEPTENNDTITYWITDTTYSHQQDTLSLVLTYLETDTLGKLSPHSDTLDFVSKQPYEKIRKEKQKQIDDWNKEREKRQKKSKEPLPPEENPYEKTWLEISAKPTGTLDPNQNMRFTAKEPLAKVDTSLIHFTMKQDTTWVEAPYLFLPVEHDLRSYMLYAEWEPEKQYRFEADSAAFRSIMGNESKAVKQEFKIKGMEEYGSIFVNVILPDTGVVVQLMNKSDKVVAEVRADSAGRADFYYLKAAEYYMRCYIDRNGNNKWDTGNYAEGLQPEEVFYFPKPMNLKAQWDLEQDWNVRSIDRSKQKPEAITKQKPDKKKSTTDRNKQREEERRNAKKGTSSRQSGSSGFGGNSFGGGGMGF